MQKMFVVTETHTVDYEGSDTITLGIATSLSDAKLLAAERNILAVGWDFDIPYNRIEVDYYQLSFAIEEFEVYKPKPIQPPKLVGWGYVYVVPSYRTLFCKVGERHLIYSPTGINKVRVQVEKIEDRITILSAFDPILLSHIELPFNIRKEYFELGQWENL